MEANGTMLTLSGIYILHTTIEKKTIYTLYFSIFICTLKKKRLKSDTSTLDVVSIDESLGRATLHTNLCESFWLLPK